MQNIDFSIESGQLKIMGFPDGIKVIKLKDGKAKKLADLFLHKSDLEFAYECLVTIGELSIPPNIVQEGLWGTAIVNYIKCFGGNESRSSLNAKNIYKKLPQAAIESFKYFKDLRDKHIAHDDNPFSQCVTGAILNNGGKDYKIEKIVCTGIRAGTLDSESRQLLMNLILEAKKWVTQEFDNLCTVITNDLEKITHNELLQKELLQFTVPKTDDVGKSRSSI